ncbi:MAG: hypothetical protein ACYDC6_08250 [Acidobacteriaceae bacterium]
MNGLWLQQQCLEHWAAAGERLDVEKLIEAAQYLPAPPVLLDVRAFSQIA